MKKTFFLLAAFTALLVGSRFLFGAATPSANYHYGTDAANAGGYFIPPMVTVKFTGATISAGSTGDLATVATGLSRYVVSSVYAESTAATGTLALATVDIRTATTGGGSSILAAPVALTGLTAADLAQSLSPMAVGSVQTAANLTLRQTVLSGFSGTVSVVVILIPVP